LAKIYKSNNIFMNKCQPVLLNIPQISQGLRDLVIGDHHSEQERIESEDVPDASGRLTVRETNSRTEEKLVSQAQLEALEILEAAKIEIDRLMEENRIKAAELFEKSRIEGLNQGIKEVEKMKESYQITVMNACQVESEKLEAEFQQKMVGLEEQLLELSLSIAEKVIPFELSRSDEALQAVIQDALNQIRIKHGITIKASKRVCEAIKTMESLQVENVQIVPQEGWANFSCQIESIFGTLDLGWEKKMERISQMLCGDLV